MILIHTCRDPDIGPIHFYHHHSSKRITLTVKPFEQVRVTLPPRSAIEEATQFISGKRDWILKKQAEMAEIEQHVNQLRNQGPQLGFDEAKAKLTSRLQHLANLSGYTYNRVFIRKQKTRWGSCSSKNNINLNYHLALIPEDLMDYVLMHELVHTEVKDHSPLFWQTLSKHIHNPKEARKKLKNYQFYLF